ncbi:cytochrome P450 protein [Rutstroemia sp. NJR-2017a BBW]|nr:cytochrome P450 protein [Rutstroemia sp. NJR-2017a BBW]
MLSLLAAVSMTLTFVYLLGILQTHAGWLSLNKAEAKSKEYLLSQLNKLGSLIKTRVNAWSFLLNGPAMIDDAYKKANGAPFIIDVPENRYHFVSTWEHIQEIDAVPDTILSLTAAAKEILQPEYTMHKFNWAVSRNKDAVPLNRTLGTYLTNWMPNLLPELRYRLMVTFDRHIQAAPLRNGMAQTPVSIQLKRIRNPSLFPILIESVAQSNIVALFGEDLLQNKEFMKRGVGFIENTLIISEINFIFDTLNPIVEQRLEERERRKMGQVVPVHHDCIQWIIDGTTKAWNAERIVHELIALWFGSVHITSTTAFFVLQDLCLHPEYIPMIRQDIERVGWDSFDQSKGRDYPLLDSFMKESSRLNPVESMSTRRIALKPFGLSGGHQVPAGEWVCTAPRAMHRDPAFYVEASEFHGFRFVEPAIFEKFLSTTGFEIPEHGKASEFNSVPDWQLWGTGRNACPGRFYASALIKSMLALFIMNYDMELTEASTDFIGDLSIIREQVASYYFDRDPLPSR